MCSHFPGTNQSAILGSQTIFYDVSQINNFYSLLSYSNGKLYITQYTLSSYFVSKQNQLQNLKVCYYFKICLNTRRECYIVHILALVYHQLLFVHKNS